VLHDGYVCLLDSILNVHDVSLGIKL
jgi:hypothetical protein